jgi:hypothetical protein
MSQYVTIPQAIEARPFLTERWLRRVRQERRIPTFTAAGRVLFRLEDIDNLVEATRLDPVH